MGRLLQTARLRAGMTQQVLCTKANLSYSTLTKIERGAIKAPSIFTVIAIAQAVGTSLDNLLGDSALVVPSSSLNNANSQKRTSKSGVSFVYFDVNGCLVKYYDQAFTQLAEASGAPFDVVETAFWHYNDRACRGELTMDEVNRAFAAALGIDRVDWLSHYLSAVEPIAEMHEMIRWASQHYRIGLLTNIMPGFVSVMMARSLIPDINYDVIIDSSVEGTIKPESEIYTIAQNKAGCPPNEILLIDDSDINLMAAEKQGWHVLQFSDYHLEQSLDHIKSVLG